MNDKDKKNWFSQLDVKTKALAITLLVATILFTFIYIKVTTFIIMIFGSLLLSRIANIFK